MKRLALYLTGLAGIMTFALYLACIDDMEQRDRLARAHTHDVQACVLNDETEGECEGRWNRAVTP